MKKVLFYIFIIFMFAAGCDDNSSNSSNDNEINDSDALALWECSEETNGWERCSENKIEYCHIVEGMDPHFHWSDDCESKGYKCVEIEDGDALCVDETLTCSDGEFSCDSSTNIAYNCIDGYKSVESCGTAKVCSEGEEKAFCEAVSEDECSGHGYLQDEICVCNEGYKVDPDDVEACIEEIAFPQLACNQFSENDPEEVTAVTSFADFSTVHVETDIPIQITLTANSEGYVHFPVTHTVSEGGEYVIFLSKAGVLDKVLDMTETELLISGGTANGKCPETLVEHWHAITTYDDVESDSPKPAIIKFKAQEEATTVSLIIKYKEAE